MGPKPLVLVVDDDADIRSLAVEVLHAANMDAVGVASGTDALAWLAAADPLPDALVLDVQMPEMDGWTTLERMRGDARLASVPVMLCTVKAATEATNPVIPMLAADRFVTKPFTIEALLDGVRATLGAASGGGTGP